MADENRQRVILITGGAGQLGRHVSLRFASRGHTVHVPVLDAEEGTRLLGFVGPAAERIRVHPGMDLARPEVVERLLRDVGDAGGASPSVLVHLAGGFRMAPVEETTPKDWEAMWQSNATTAFLCARAVLPAMRDAGWGRILTVSAYPAIDRGKSGLSAYGAAKAAVLNLTQTLAREGAAHGITANAVLPSIIDTPANREVMPGADRSTWLPPEAVADVLEFLASDQARIVNGAAIPLTLHGEV